MPSIDEQLNRAMQQEGDIAKRDSGARLVELLGRSAPDETDGFGDPLHPGIASLMPVDEFGIGGPDRSLLNRLASVSAHARGLGVIMPQAAYGDKDATPSWTVVGRVAQGRHDTLGTFQDIRPQVESGWVDRDGAYSPILRPRLNIPIPANVATMITVRARLRIKSANSQTACYARIKIGSGSTFMPEDSGGQSAIAVPLEDNEAHAFGRRGEAGLSDEWHDLEVFHARRVSIAATSQKPEGEIIPVRIYLAATSTGTNRIKGGSIEVERVPL